MKPLTSDQKVQNAIFLQQLRRRWLATRDAVVAAAGAESMRLLEHFLTKEKSNGPGRVARPSAADLKRRALHNLGTAKLSKWVEEDVEEAEAAEKVRAESKRHEAAHAHEAFVRGKKALELWLPARENSGSTGPKAPRFVFATGGKGAIPLRSKQAKIACTTVDMMRSSGLRVVHALSAGKQGREADLEKSRSQLEREGHVSKRNYADASDYEAAKTKVECGSTLEVGERVRTQVKTGPKKEWVVVKVERRTSSRFQVTADGESRMANGAEMRKASGGAVVGSTGRVEAGEAVVVDGGRWAVTKDCSAYLVTWMSGSARHEAEVDRDELKRLSGTQQRQVAADESYREWIEVKRSRELARDYLSHIECPDELKTPSGALADEPTALAHWKAVGKHLKVVDRCLLDEWFEWSKGFEVTSYICQVLWDSFEPIGDDVHTSYYSLARTTLGTILRPGLGFKEAVSKVVKRKWRVAAAKGDDMGEMEDATASEVAPFKQLSRSDLKAVLSEVGLHLSADQLRLVVDCFDDEGRGTMDAVRFIDFTGISGPRNKAEALQRLRQRTPPLWESTCPVTGLANAFRVTTAPVSAKDTPEDRRTSVISLANGEKRRQVELKERQRRIAVLKHFDEYRGAADDDYSDDDHDEDEAYSDDDADGADGAGDREAAGKAKKANKCTVAQWMENNGARMKVERAAALRELMNLSRVRRDEAELQGLLEKGQPPAAPLFYAAGPSDPEVLRRGDPLEENLLLCWEAPPQSLVAFFSVEMSGPRGSKEQRENIFTEICRDPDCARDSFRYMTWVRGLQPGTSYSFRVRAFNGFGPGPYNWEMFTTRPRRPPRPLVLARTPTSVTLRWADDAAERWVASLEEVLDLTFPGLVFDQASVGRQELAAALERCAGAEAVDALRRKSTTTGLGGEDLGSAVSLLDALDLAARDEAGGDVQWPEVRAFLLRAAEGSVAGSSARGKAPSPSTTQVRYNIEQCVSVTAGQWVKVLSTKFSFATIPALDSGQAYRFRIVAVNANGLESKKSPSAIATTLLETPPPPRLAPCRPRPDGSACLKLCWDPAAVFGIGLPQREQRKQAIDRILSSWTREGADDEGAVSLAAAFRRQPSYRGPGGAPGGAPDGPDGGTGEAGEVIAGKDVGGLLRDLGLEPSEAKKAELLDRTLSEGGTVTLADAKKWWTSEGVVYEVRKDAGSPLEVKGAPPATRSKDVSILCYRGSSEDGPASCVVAGLEPSTHYCFTLRVRTARSSSAPSKVLYAVTPPAPMDRPVVIESEPRSVALKWYPGRNGAHKYLVECRLVEALDWERDRAVEAAQAKLRAAGWRVVYEGRDNTARLLVAGGAAATSGEGLLPNSVYHCRVTGLNDSCGAPSEPTLLRTAGRAGQNPLLGLSSRVLKPTNAHEHFTVECRGDVVVGDTIICTEQLFVGPDGRLAKPKIKTATFKSGKFNGAGSAVAARAVAEGSVFVGERTVAAVVVKDNFRSPEHSRDLGWSATEASRMLRLEVLWSTVSSDTAGTFVLERGDVIERDEAALSEFEVFRIEWKEEGRRLPEARERVLCKKLVI